jgi:uncharacterized protein (DUF433 family)
MRISQDDDHSAGAPTIEGTGIRVTDVASAYKHSGYDPDEITQLYPALSVSDVHRALAYYDHIREFRDNTHTSALSARTLESLLVSERQRERGETVSSAAMRECYLNEDE